MRRRFPYIISIEGGIAAGKTDFLSKCQDNYLNIMVSPEPKHLWRNVRDSDAPGTHEDPFAPGEEM